MPNDYFQFKEFMVRQDKCAMKVCTDSCLLGAYAAMKIQKLNYEPANILDIGGGTGLLSLMLAQKLKATIDSLEIDSAAVEQMKENFQTSPWKNQLNAVYGDIRTFHEKKYDIIITNPPFFENDLKGSHIGKTLAKHDTGLLLSELATSIANSLKPNGNFYVMVPCSRSLYLRNLLGQQHLSVNEILNISHNSMHNPFRSIISGSNNNEAKQVTVSDLLIFENENKYSVKFSELLKDYYLNL